MSTADTQFDMRIDSERDIQVVPGGDLGLTRTKEEYIANFLAIATGNEVRNLIGAPQDASTYEAAKSEIRSVLEDNPQIDTVLVVSITEVDTRVGSITVDIELKEDGHFEIELEG